MESGRSRSGACESFRSLITRLLGGRLRVFRFRREVKTLSERDVCHGKCGPRQRDFDVGASLEFMTFILYLSVLKVLEVFLA